MRRFWAACWLAIGAVGLTGCEVEAPPAPTARPARAELAPSNPGPAVDTATPVAAVSAEANFASVGEALASLRRACEQKNGDDISAANRWLSKRAAEAGPQLAQAATDAGADPTFRVAVCRLLAFTGTSATEPLLAAAGAREDIVRVKALESLGAIKSTDARVVERLIAALSDESQNVRRTAIRSLGQIGPPARSAAPKLQQVLNSLEEDETIRGLAKDTLKKVDPRVGFRQGELNP